MQVHVESNRWDVGVDFLNGFKLRDGPAHTATENLQVASCQLGIGPNIRLALREDIEGVKGQTRNCLSTT